MTPAIKPTSQYGPCSEAKRTATSQKESGAYFPSGTFWKSLLISQRISHPRQNSSSAMGTKATDPRMRIARNHDAVFRSGAIELDAAPVMALSNSQKCL